MAFLLGSKGAQAQLSGQHQDPALLQALLQLSYNWDWTEVVSAVQLEADNIIDDVSDVTHAFAGSCLAAGIRAKEAAWLRNSILILSPMSMPAVNLPFMVSQ